MIDAFERVAAALRARADAMTSESVFGAWDGDVVRTRNLLLDDCGSDHRALVELLLSVGDDVRRALPTHGLAASPSGDSWETRRAPIVHRLVSTRYLQPDIARWLVDTWAYATALRQDMPASPSMQQVSERTNPVATLTSPRGRAAKAASATAAPIAKFTRSASALPARAAAVSPRVTGWAGSRGPMTPAELARIKHIERISLWVLAGSVVIGFGAEGYALRSRPVDRWAQTPAAEITRQTIAQRARDSADYAAFRAADSMVAVSVVDTNPTRYVDSVGRAWLGSVAGRYRVTHHRVSVGGSDGCEAVAEALAQQQQSVEVVEQSSGSSAIRLIARNVRGMVEPDGRFTTGPDSGTTDGVSWTFSMAGQFTATGFTAQVQKTTDATLGWHKSRSCSVVAELVGTRIRG